LGVEPPACLYVGDGAYAELTGASALGMRAVLVRDDDVEGLRPEAEDWRGERIDHLEEVLGLLDG
jgi:FMN phosphatase YigB (HAD superfamily)